MASNVNVGTGLAPARASTISSSLYCKACGAANPLQATQCVACREPFSTSTGGPATNPLTGLLLPKVLIKQRYRILDVSSTGEASAVYKAEDMLLGNRTVALKEIGQDDSSAQDASAALEVHRREMLL